MWIYSFFQHQFYWCRLLTYFFGQCQWSWYFLQILNHHNLFFGCQQSARNLNFPPKNSLPTKTKKKSFQFFLFVLDFFFSTFCPNSPRPPNLLFPDFPDWPVPSASASLSASANSPYMPMWESENGQKGPRQQLWRGHRKPWSGTIVDNCETIMRHERQFRMLALDSPHWPVRTARFSESWLVLTGSSQDIATTFLTQPACF